MSQPDWSDELRLKAREIQVQLVINEANEIWRRFNYLMALNAALFVLYGTLAERDTVVAGVVACFGAVISGIGIVVLRRLWIWLAKYVRDLNHIDKPLREASLLPSEEKKSGLCLRPTTLVLFPVALLWVILVALSLPANICTLMVG